MFFFFGCIIILSLAFPLLISCGQNNHDFSIKWENDENYHWHVCQIEGHNDTSKKEFCPQEINKGKAKDKIIFLFFI